MRIVVVTLFALLAFVASCKNNENKSKAKTDVYDTIIYPAAQAIDTALASAIARSANNYANQFLIPNNYAGGLLIAWKGNIIFERYIGNKNVNGILSPIINTDPIHVASTSKTFTAHIILLLYQQGKLKLTDTMQQFFPNFPYKNITVFNLLTHRSGLAKYDYFMEGERKKPLRFGFMLSNNDVINYMDSAKPEAYKPVNTGFQYNNTNFMLLASIAEKVSGKPFATLMHDEIFKPLGMKNSYVACAADTNRNIRSMFKNGNLYPYTELDGTYGDKNVYTTAQDMLKWHMYLQHKNRLRQSLIDSSYAGYSNEKIGIKNYGFGWRMFNLPGDKKITFHNGYWHGNNSCFTRLINDDVVIISTGNRLCKQGYGMMSFTGFFGNYLGFEKESEDSAQGFKVDVEAANMQKFIYENVKPVTPKPLQPIKPVKQDTAKMRLDSLKKDSLLRLKAKGKK